MWCRFSFRFTLARWFLWFLLFLLCVFLWLLVDMNRDKCTVCSKKGRIPYEMRFIQIHIFQTINHSAESFALGCCCYCRCPPSCCVRSVLSFVCVMQLHPIIICMFTTHFNVRLFRIQFITFTFLLAENFRMQHCTEVDKRTTLNNKSSGTLLENVE